VLSGARAASEKAADRVEMAETEFVAEKGRLERR
jgi:hypothetical protein